MTTLVPKPQQFALHLYHYIPLKFVVQNCHHSVTLRHFVSFTCSLHSCHHRVTGTATDPRLSLSVTSVCPPRVFCNALASYQPSRHRMNYPYFSTCSQAITGRAFAQEDSGCVFIEHDCLLNIVLVAKSDVIITQLAPNT